MYVGYHVSTIDPANVRFVGHISCMSAHLMGIKSFITKIQLIATDFSRAKTVCLR